MPVFDGDPDHVDSRGSDVVPQVAGTLDVRLAAAAGSPAFVVGMDTPRLTPQHLTEADEALSDRDVCRGRAVDGGWWGLGLRRAGNPA